MWTGPDMVSRRSLLAAAAVAGGLWPILRTVAQSRPPAPEFVGIDGWINTDSPLTIAGLRGKVVLVDFWTYSCINCRRTIPYLNRWQAEYGPHGLRVIGIHTPEFGFEHMRPNVADGVRALGIRYPVGQDNEFRTWNAWSNEAWPAFYLLDKDGRIVLLREGEGNARELEAAIRALLGLAPASGRASDDPDLSRIETPEIYFGALHPTPLDRAPFGKGPTLNHYQLDGAWEQREEALILRSSHGGMRIRFSAAKLHLVASAPQPAPLRVTVEASPARTIEINRPTLYTLFDGNAFGEHLLEFDTETPGLSVFSATFG